MFRKVITAARYLAAVLGVLSQFPNVSAVAATPASETIAQEALLKARIDGARAKLSDALGAEVNGLPGAGKLAQWFNWPNWQNWNNWRNW